MKVLQFLKLEEYDSIINSSAIISLLASVNCNFCYLWSLSKHSVLESSIVFSSWSFIETVLKRIRQRKKREKGESSLL